MAEPKLLAVKYGTLQLEKIQELEGWGYIVMEVAQVGDVKLVGGGQTMATSYKLTITKIEDNPQYDVQKTAEEADRQARGYMPGSVGYLVPSPTIETRQLETTVTEAEFLAIKQAVLKEWA